MGSSKIRNKVLKHNQILLSFTIASHIVVNLQLLALLISLPHFCVGFYLSLPIAKIESPERPKLKPYLKK